MHLNKDGPVDHCKSRGDKHFGMRGNFFSNQKDKSKCNSTPKATVHHDELFGHIQLLNPVSVRNVRENENSDDPTNDAGSDGTNNKPPVPPEM